jgi:fatty acid synthase subunit beta
METRTLNAKYETLDGSVSQHRSVLRHAKNVQEIHYQYEDEIKTPTSIEVVDAPTALTPITPTTTTVVVSAPLSRPVASIDDVPITAVEIHLGS